MPVFSTCLVSVHPGRFEIKFGFSEIPGGGGATDPSALPPPPLKVSGGHSGKNFEPPGLYYYGSPVNDNVKVAKSFATRTRIAVHCSVCAISRARVPPGERVGGRSGWAGASGVLIINGFCRRGEYEMREPRGIKTKKLAHKREISAEQAPVLVSRGNPRGDSVMMNIPPPRTAFQLLARDNEYFVRRNGGRLPRLLTESSQLVRGNKRIT